MHALVGMKDSWPAVLQGHAQSGKGQRLIHLATQGPAAHRSGVGSKNYRQVDGTPLEAEISDVSAPELLWMSDSQLANQVRIAPLGMVAGGFARPRDCLGSAGQTQMWPDP